MKAAREVPLGEVIEARHQANRAVVVARFIRESDIVATQMTDAPEEAWKLAARGAGLRSVPSAATRAIVLVLLEQGVI